MSSPCTPLFAYIVSIHPFFCSQEILTSKVAFPLCFYMLSLSSTVDSLYITTFHLYENAAEAVAATGEAPVTPKLGGIKQVCAAMTTFLFSTTVCRKNLEKVSVPCLPLVPLVAPPLCTPSNFNTNYNCC